MLRWGGENAKPQQTQAATPAGQSEGKWFKEKPFVTSLFFIKVHVYTAEASFQAEQSGRLGNTFQIKSWLINIKY